jgi:hypothetical protein
MEGERMTRVDVQMMAQAMHQILSDPDTEAHEARLHEILARYRTTPDLAIISEKLRGLQRATGHIPSEDWIAGMLCWVFCLPNGTYVSDNVAWQSTPTRRR